MQVINEEEESRLKTVARWAGFIPAAVIVSTVIVLILSFTWGILNSKLFDVPGIMIPANFFGGMAYIEVEDHCGGLLPSEAETMFLPFNLSGENMTGLGLGLSISRRSVEVNGGTLSVRDAPGSGCVFTIKLPSHSLAGPALT